MRERERERERDLSRDREIWDVGPCLIWVCVRFMVEFNWVLGVIARLAT